MHWVVITTRVPPSISLCRDGMSEVPTWQEADLRARVLCSLHTLPAGQVTCQDRTGGARSALQTVMDTGFPAPRGTASLLRLTCSRIESTTEPMGSIPMLTERVTARGVHLAHAGPTVDRAGVIAGGGMHHDGDLPEIAGRCPWLRRRHSSHCHWTGGLLTVATRQKRSAPVSRP